MMVLTACEKEGAVAPIDGTYAGTFSIVVNDKEQISDFEVVLNAKRFRTTKGVGGQGPFEVLSNNKIKFTDENFYTANFNWAILLSGTYTYEIKGDRLILNKILENPVKGNYYQYKLKKIN